MFNDINKNLSFLLIIFLIQGCPAHYPVNEELATVDSKSGVRIGQTTAGAGGRSDNLLVGLAFSGGGTRASAYYVSTLRKTPYSFGVIFYSYSLIQIKNLP